MTPDQIPQVPEAVSLIAAILAGVFGYLLGSIPFGLVLTRLAGLGDIRQIGSGNIGATNVLRTGRKGLALATLLLDGGKGVATTFGTLLAASWPVGLACCATWLVTAAVFRYSSLSALVGLALSPAFALVFAGPDYAAMAAGLAVMGFYRHKANIVRLIRGEEPRIGGKKSGEPPS